MTRLLLVVAIILAPSISAESRLDFWSQQRKGVNCFNKVPSKEWFAAAAAANIRFVRLTFSKWDGAGRDFLLGNADQFDEIPQADLRQLQDVLGWANEWQIKVVIVPLSLPGARWSQQNGRKFDPRLWNDFDYHRQSAAFWKKLATALSDHPAVVGYEILNEPAPERALGEKDEWQTDFAAFARHHADSPADLNKLYATVIPAIRSVDAETPIVLSCSFFGFAGAMCNLKPVDDPRVIYSFHTYEPYAYTNFRTNSRRFSYPGEVVTGTEPLKWDSEQMRRHVGRVAEWASGHGIPASRIWVGEFGCDRRVPGAEKYLADSIKVFNDHRWHWSVYSFREDEWDAFDYECGEKPLPWSYWQAIERGEAPARPRTANRLWDVLQGEFQNAGP